MTEQSSEETFNNKAAVIVEQTWNSLYEYEHDQKILIERAAHKAAKEEDFSWVEYRTGQKGWS